MRIIAACILALMLAGCAAEEHKPFVATAEQDAAVERYSICLVKAAQSSDDHISDAVSIGLAILPMCAADYQRSMDALTQDMSLGEKVMFLRKANAQRLELATSVVVKNRRASAAR